MGKFHPCRLIIPYPKILTMYTRKWLDWQQARSENYRQKLNLSKHRARKRLLQIPSSKRYLLYDAVVDKEYLSTNEPGTKYTTKQRDRRQAIVKAIQLKLF